MAEHLYSFIDEKTRALDKASAVKSESEVAEMLGKGHLCAFIAVVTQPSTDSNGVSSEYPVGMACYYLGYHIRSGPVGKFFWGALTV